MIQEKFSFISIEMPDISITTQEEFKKNNLILLTGPTGYVGGRLLKVLEENQFRLRCLARRPDLLRPRVDSKTDVVKADVLDRNSLFSAMHGVKIAFYLVHSMGSAESFEENDRIAAQNFGEIAKEAGVNERHCVTNFNRNFLRYLLRIN